jgi:hypothetical protein
MAGFADRVDHAVDVVDAGVGGDAVAEVEDVGAVAKARTTRRVSSTRRRR